MSTYLWATLIGVIAGLRSMTAPAAVSWAARLGRLHLGGSLVAFLGYSATPYIFTVLALVELITDKLPRTPSRKTPGPFAARVLLGALAGAAIGANVHNLIGGAAAGAVGAVIGTLGGYQFRRMLVLMIGGNDLPVALLEDAIAIGGAIFIVTRFG
jgi:uncharacterized membrane protein